MTTTINNEHKKLNFSNEREQSQACLNSAEHEKNQGRKVLNVPNKREQNQTSLDSAEREGLSPKGNVPNLRFPEFEGEWDRMRLDVNPAKRNVLDLKNETCKNREKRNVLKISHTRHFKTTKSSPKWAAFIVLNGKRTAFK